MVTVEGQYENVRRFIRDVERSRQFVVINEVELQRASIPMRRCPSKEKRQNPVNLRSLRRARDRVALVSLQLSMYTTSNVRLLRLSRRGDKSG